MLQIESLEEVLGRMAARDRKYVIKGLEALVEVAGREALPSRRHDGGEVLLK